MDQTIKINKISNDESSLIVKWSDGELSTFDYLWLRDNCPSEIHPDARERMFNIMTVSENIRPETYKINNDGMIEIKWNEKNHTSCFNPNWLRKHCYTINNKKNNVSPYKLWDKDLAKYLGKLSVECEEIMQSDESLTKWLEILHQYGISILRNAPTKKNSGLEVLKRISHIRETFFGSPFEVINIPKPNNTAYTASALENHTDLPYFEMHLDISSCIV